MLRLWIVTFCLLLSPPLLAIEVEDDAGHQVRLASSATRIISLAPHLTEQLFAIGAGDKLIAAVDYSDYPEAARALPRVGGYSRLDLERIVALKPDLIVAWESGNDPRQLERLEQLGLIVYRSEPRRLGDIAEGMSRLGVLAGVAEQAQAEANKFNKRVARLGTMNAGKAPLKVFYQIWNSPLMTINGEHLISDVIALCGGVNIFADLPAFTPKISIEAVLVADPDIIIASGMGVARPEWLDDWRRWRQLKAVAGEQLHFIPPELLQRATPRLLDGAEQVCRAVAEAHN